MKKSPTGEVVLSAGQIQATRLNRLEYRRLQNHIHSLRDDLKNHLGRIHREEQGLRYHFTNVVRVIKPNPAYQLWKQAHAREIAQDEAKDLIESIKSKQKLNPASRPRRASSLNESPSEPVRPLLLLVESDSDRSLDPMIDKTAHVLRPKTSPVNKRSIVQRRMNPLIALLDECSGNSNTVLPQRPHYPFESSSFYSASSMVTTSSRKFNQNKFPIQNKAANIDVLYRMALQNQTAYKSVDKKLIDQRKLQDKEFASQHRALKGSIRLARTVN